MRYILISVFLVFAGAAIAGETVPPDLQVLVNLKTVPVSADDIRIDGVPKDPVCPPSQLFTVYRQGSCDFDTQGRLSTQIETYVSSRMKLVAGPGPLRAIPKQDDSASSPELMFSVWIEHHDANDSFGTLTHYTVQCSLVEPIMLLRDPNPVVRRPTWSRIRTGFTESQSEIEAVKKAVCGLTQQFLEDYYKATPTWIVNKGSPDAWRAKR